MEYTPLGRTGARVSRLALGTATFSVAPREKDAINLVHKALDSGINSRMFIMQQIERTLRRLGTDHLDIYYAHHPDPSTPMDHTIRAFDLSIETMQRLIKTR